MATTNGVLVETPTPAPGGTRWLTRERLLTLALAGVTVVALYLCYRIALPFIPALTWALALAIVARPVHRWIAERVANADLAAGLAVAFVAVAILAPTWFVGRHLLQEARATADRFQQAADGDPVALAERAPWLAEQLDWLGQYVDVRGGFQQVVGWVAARAAELVTGSAWAAVELLIVLYILYFLFRDRATILRGLRSMVPLSAAETDEVFARVDDTIYATVYGTVVVALLQGALGGLMFWWLGLPAPVLWGVVMALLAVIPFLGAFVVWVPAAVMLVADGLWGKALVLAGWGTVAVGLIDNLVYPLLVGQRLRLHTVPVFIAFVGGLALFGAAGIILGPAVFAVTLALLDIWRRRTAWGQSAEAGAKAAPAQLDLARPSP
jgi:predicted PurR-regulated permease PerM